MSGQPAGAAPGGQRAAATSLSSSMKSVRRPPQSLVDYSMYLGRDGVDANILNGRAALEDDVQEFADRVEPFFDDVPQILEEMDDTLWDAKMYRDNLVHSRNNSSAKQAKAVWDVVSRPSPQYMCDRIDVEKEFLSSKQERPKPRPAAALAQPSGHSEPREPAHLNGRRLPARRIHDPQTSWKRSAQIPQPESHTLRPQQDTIGADAPAPDGLGLSLLMLEKRQQQEWRARGNHVRLTRGGSGASSAEAHSAVQKATGIGRPKSAQISLLARSVPNRHGRPQSACPAGPRTHQKSPTRPGRKSESYAELMHKAQAKYDKLVRTMEDMGDFADLAAMDTKATFEASKLESWVDEWERASADLGKGVSSAKILPEESSVELPPPPKHRASSPDNHTGAGSPPRQTESTRKPWAQDVLAGEISGTGPNYSLHPPEDIDLQTKELIQFNEILGHLLAFSEESERARKEYENNTLSIFKAAKAASKQKAYPLEVVERYVDVSRSRLQGLKKLEQLLAHTRRQAQVIAEHSAVQTGSSGTELFKEVERDLRLELLGSVQGDLSKLSTMNHPEAANGAAASEMKPHRKSVSSPMNEEKLYKLSSWLQRIISKQGKRNEVRSRDVQHISEKMQNAGKGVGSNSSAAAAAMVDDCKPEGMEDLLYYILNCVLELRDSGNSQLGGMMAMALQALISELQFLVAMLQATQGSGSPHLKVLTSLIQGMHGERMLRTAGEQHIKSLGQAAEGAAVRSKQLASRSDDLSEKLAAKDKALIVVKGELGENQEEVRMLRERVKVLEEEVRLLEGNMTLAEHRALSTGQVVKNGLRFQGTLKTAELVCSWNKLSKEVQATGNGRADDPHAIVPDIIEHIPEPQPAAQKSVQRKKKGTKKSKGP